MSNEHLTARLAEEVLGWKTAPGRFIKSGRNWLPRWRFQPFTNLEDAFHLLDAAGATFTLTLTAVDHFHAKVRVGKRTGNAHGSCKPAVISIAIARALNLGLPKEAERRVGR